MQDDREPIRTYGDAIGRLAFWTVTERFSAHQLELASKMVADVFWLSDEKVAYDVKKSVRSIVVAACPSPRSRRGDFYGLS